MPRWTKSDTGQRLPLDWTTTITRRLTRREVLPIVSKSVGNNLFLSGHIDLLEEYKKEAKYPFDQPNLSRMAQFKGVTDDDIADERALKEDYIDFVKNRLFDIAESDNVAQETLDNVTEQFDQLSFSDFCRQLGYPKFRDSQNHTLLLLASLKLPIYVTTSFHRFLEMAIQKAGQEPRTEYSRWNAELRQRKPLLEAGYSPTPENPLVFHLHGLDEQPDSLVLTEDDHIRFLVAASQSVGQDSDPVQIVRSKFSEHSLLLLGFGLQSWDFRTLFWGLVVPRTMNQVGVYVQLKPDKNEQYYYQKYLRKHDIRVHWGETHAYLKQIRGAKHA